MKVDKRLNIQTIVLLRSFMSFFVSFSKKDMSFFGKQWKVGQERHRECVSGACPTSFRSARRSLGKDPITHSYDILDVCRCDRRSGQPVKSAVKSEERRVGKECRSRWSADN